MTEPTATAGESARDGPVDEELLAHLDAFEPPVSIVELSTAIAADRDECPPSDVSRARRRAVMDELLSEAVPELVAAGALEFDPLLATVEPSETDE